MADGDETIKKAIDAVDGLTGAVDKLKESTEKAAEKTSDLAKSAANLEVLRIQVRAIAEQWAAASIELDRLERAKEQDADAIDNQEKALKHLANTLSDYKSQIAEVNGELGEGDKNQRRLVQSQDMIAQSISRNISVMKYWTVALGGGAFTTRLITKNVADFNKSMFAASQVQSIFGRKINAAGKNFGEMQSTLDHVRKSTILTSKEFTQLAGDITMAWKGIPPTLREVAAMTTSLQETLGPDPQRIQAGVEALMAVHNQFPALAKDIKDMQKDIASPDVNVDDQSLETLKARILLTQKSSGLSEQQTRILLQSVTALTKEEKELVKLNEEWQKFNQSVQESSLQIGKNLEPVMVSAGKVFSFLANQINITDLALVGLSGILYKSLNVYKKYAAAAYAAAAANTTLAGSSALPALPFGQRALIGAGKATGRIKNVIGGKSVKGVKGTMRKARLGGAVGLGIGALSLGANVWGAPEGEKKSTLVGGLTGLGGAAGGAALGGMIGGLPGALLGAAAGGLLGDDIIAPWLKSMMGVEEESKDAEENISQSAKSIAAWRGEAEIARMNFEFTSEAAAKTTNQIEQQIQSLEKMKIVDIDSHKDLFDALISSIIAAKVAAEDFINSSAGIQSYQRLLNAISTDMNIDPIRFDESVQGIEKAGIMLAQIAKIIPPMHSEIRMLQEEFEKLGEGEENDEKRLELSKDIDKSISNRTALLQLQEQLRENINKIVSAEAAEQDALFKGALAYRDQLSEIQGLTEQRIDAERAVMESAQFGMGASLAMMQQQVDLAYSRMQIEDEAIQRMRQALIERSHLEAGITKEQLSRIENARNATEVEEISQDIAAKTGISQQDIVKYYMEQQKASKNILDQQQKIFDLTKDIREGYLDAIQEMAFGAGEFSKIIGTQEMGVTQLMDAVDQFTTKGQKNIYSTMKSGGMQTREQTEAGAGTGITGRYSAQGKPLQFIGDEEVSRRNERLWNFNERRTGRSRVGSGVVPGAARYLGPDIENDYTGAVNRGVKIGGFGDGGNIDVGGSMAERTALARSSQASAPADLGPSVAKPSSGSHTLFDTEETKRVMLEAAATLIKVGEEAKKAAEEKAKKAAEEEAKNKFKAFENSKKEFKDAQDIYVKSATSFNEKLQRFDDAPSIEGETLGLKARSGLGYVGNRLGYAGKAMAHGIGNWGKSQYNTVPMKFIRELVSGEKVVGGSVDKRLYPSLQDELSIKTNDIAKKLEEVQRAKSAITAQEMTLLQDAGIMQMSSLSPSETSFEQRMFASSGTVNRNLVTVELRLSDEFAGDVKRGAGAADDINVITTSIA